MRPPGLPGGGGEPVDGRGGDVAGGAGQRVVRPGRVGRLDRATSGDAAQRRKPAELASSVQDRTTVLENVSRSLERGRDPDRPPLRSSALDPPRSGAPT
ncbi:hypothetical protein CLM85_33945 [Streptomyces albidoflavus]|nr:hypothetical protein CLM85_33945 [Streptomyces albidoflavus]